MASFADTFTSFSLLPKELRLQIWGAALNPRVIVLHRNSDRSKAQQYYFPFSRVAFKIPLFMALTTHDPSLDVIQRVCAESMLFCRRRYMELEVWDIRKNCLGTFYDPHYDVIYFSHVNPVVLQEFATQYPVETCSMETLAFPGRISPAMFSKVDVLTALRIFANLKEVIIVLGSVSRGDDDHELAEDTLFGGDETSLWARSRNVEKMLERMKFEKWPDWTPPTVITVESQEDIQCNRGVHSAGRVHQLPTNSSDSVVP